jgi:hypothetical protein
VKSLLKSIGESESGFAEFAADIVRRLQDEGFIRSKKGALWLAD